MDKPPRRTFLNRIILSEAMNLRIVFARLSIISIAQLFCAMPLPAQQIPLSVLVTPSTVITKDGRPVPFALHGFIEFQSLSQVFPYIESQANRWATLDATQRRELSTELLRHGVESRVISMADERPLETLVTHT